MTAATPGLQLHAGMTTWFIMDPINSFSGLPWIRLLATPCVLFYDRRNSQNNRKQSVTLARSTDGGRTFKNYSWTNETFAPAPPSSAASNQETRAVEARRARATLVQV